MALINQRDQDHRRAVDLARRIRGRPLLVTDAVLLEVGTVLASGHRRESVAVIERFLRATNVEIVHLTPELFGRAFTPYRTHEDKEWSLVDCISFVVMRDTGIAQALTYDQHFVQAGFQALMREGSQI